MKLWLILSGVLLSFTLVGAEEFELNVVRAGANLYEVPAEDLYVQTEYCFEVEEKASVLLRLEDAEKSMTFSDSGARCDVILVYGRTTLEAGNYNLTVTRVDDNWYGLDGEDAALKTSGCLSLVEQADAKLEMKDDGTGVLRIPSVDEECQVEGVYTKAELKLVKE